MWRKFIKPRLKILFDAEKHGQTVYICSCGDIGEIIPDIMKIGVGNLSAVGVTGTASPEQILSVFDSLPLDAQS